MRRRHRERDEHRLDLRDGHELRVVGGDEVARLHRDVADAPVDGRADDAVAELHLGRVDGRLLHVERRLRAGDRCLVGLDGRCRRVGLGARLFADVLRDDALLHELCLTLGTELLVFGVGRVARELRLGLGEQRLIAHEVGLRLFQRGFNGR